MNRKTGYPKNWKEVRLSLSRLKVMFMTMYKHWYIYIYIYICIYIYIYIYIYILYPYSDKAYIRIWSNFTVGTKRYHHNYDVLIMKSSLMISVEEITFNTAKHWVSLHLE